MSNVETDLELAEMQGVKVPGVTEYVGGLAGAVPFFLHISNSSTTMVNGVTTAARHFDYVAVSGGVVAGLFGVISLALLAKTAPSKRALRGMAAGAILLLAAFQLARGFGVVGA
jgi:hypothetical protein